MSLSAIPKILRAQVFERDSGCCQYCRLLQVGQAPVFHINHIVPRSRGGKTILENLALQCPHCSLHKSDKTERVDPISGSVVNLFHPLNQRWHEHFMLDCDGSCHGKTEVGRVTVEILRMNDLLPKIARSLQIRHGIMILEAE